MKIMKRPNLFDFATKELSQDAFLAWLLQWAAPENAQYDPEMQKAGEGFVKMLLGKEGDAGFRVEKIAVYQQREHVDIWAEINDAYVLIIEDKVGANEHSGQLERYRELAAKQCGSERKLRCVYLKTGSVPQNALRQVEEKGYAVVNRKKLLDFLGKHVVENVIYADFADRLRRIEESEDSWRTLPIGKWFKESWIGFYQWLEEMMYVESWGDVSNPSGGFVGLWWHFLKWRGCNVYWQIEQGNLCLKLGEVYENQGAIRDEWMGIVFRHAQESGHAEIERPRRRPGTYMTTAIVPRQAWLGADEELIDTEAVVERLKKYEAFLDECLK